MKPGRLHVDVVGSSAGSTGWATHAVNFAIAMNRRTPVRFRCLDSPRREAAQGFFGPLRNPLLRGLKKQPGDFGVVVRGNPLLPERATRWIVWETTELPAAQREICATTRFLWTPSAWGRDNLIANGIDAARIAVVPEGVDTRFFRPAARKPNRFRFLMVGKWESRKFPEGLLRAFTEEFAPGEPVELYLQAHNGYLPGFSLKERVERTGVRNDGSILLGEACSAAALRALYRSADCFVLPTRAEGWGLPILESMACGVPAIVTRYSAPLDYLDEANGYPLDVARMVEAHDEDFGIHGGMWAEPDIAHLRHLMRSAYQNKEERLEKGRMARLTAERFTWNHSAGIALDTIRQHLAA
ncbi:glycosyltransferase family 4 protein [Massilia sp. TN1-12]|uniref:glycosyltransferase family 4 protein n=1 Tax=Massilia paldalensis TaxID=3377675 RepID=UPI00384C6E8B